MKFSNKDRKVLQRTGNLKKMSKINYISIIILIVGSAGFFLIGFLKNIDVIKISGILMFLLGISWLLSVKRQIALYEIIQKIKQKEIVDVDKKVG